MKTRLISVALLIALSLAGCTPNDPPEPAPDATSQSVTEATDKSPAKKPKQTEAANIETPPAAPVADADACVETWYDDAAAVERRWDLLDEALAADFYFTAPGLASGVLIPLLEGLIEHEACTDLAEPLMEAVTELAQIDGDRWQMFPERHRGDVDTARRLMREFLTTTGNMPQPTFAISTWADNGVVGIEDYTRMVVFFKDTLRTGPEVEQAFAQGDLETGGNVIAAPVFVANRGPDMYLGEVDFLWVSTTGRQYRPLSIVSDDGSITLPRRTANQMEDVDYYASLLVFFDIFSGDADGEVYATIDGTLWANLTNPSSGNVLEITEDWRFTDD